MPFRALARTSVLALALMGCVAHAATDPTVGMVSVFQEDFHTLRLRVGPPPWPVPSPVPPLSSPEFSWLSAYRDTTAPDAQGLAWSTLGDEIEAYPNQAVLEALKSRGVESPLSVGPDGLTITARPMPAAAQALLPRTGESSKATILSGAIDSYPYAMTYGYAEVVMKVPTIGVSKGMWPAFWLLANTWPPEIDVMEHLGNEQHVYQSIHTNDTLWQAREGKGTSSKTDATSSLDMTVEHAYGVKWDHDHIRFYVDRVQTSIMDTPKDLQGAPCRILINLAVGGAKSWGGTPDSSTRFPAQLHVRSVRVWQEPASSPGH